MWVLEMDRKNQKEFSVLKIIAFESATTNCHNAEQDTCHWPSMIYQTRLRFNMSLKEAFPKSRSLTVTKKYDESALMQVLQQFENL